MTQKIYVENWQFCDGSHFQDGIPQLGVPNGWILSYVDGQPIPVADPPIIGYRPESVCASIWDVGGEYGKFGNSPPNPHGYNTVFKVHKGFAAFSFALSQEIKNLIPGKTYRVIAYYFPDFYNADGSFPEDPYTAAFGIGINGVVDTWNWATTLDTWQTATREFVAPAESVTVSLDGFSKWGLAGNTFWIHGMEIFTVDATPEPPETQPGAPRIDYPRTYTLFHPQDLKELLPQAVATTTSLGEYFTFGFSADDAGIGALTNKRVIVINPAMWETPESSLDTFFATYYPDVTLIPVYATSAGMLDQELRKLLVPETPLTDTRGLKIFCQRDPRWNNVQLGNSQLTLGNSGCAVTAVSMLASSVDTTITPEILNARLTANGGYTQEGLLYWGKVAAVVPGLKFIDYTTWRTTPKPDADVAFITAAVEKFPCIIQVDYNAATTALNSHFVVALKVTPDQDILIIDPWDGAVTTLKARYWRGSLAQSVFALARYLPVTEPPIVPVPEGNNPGNLLGLHLQTCVQADLDFIARTKPNVVKFLNSAGGGEVAAKIKAVAPETKVIYRHHFLDTDIQQIVANPAAKMSWALAQIPDNIYAAVNTGLIDYIETPCNEANQWFDNATWAAADLEFIRKLREKCPKARPVTMCISVGNPPNEADYTQLMELARATALAGGAGGYHAYFGVNNGQRFENWAPWHEYRFERIDRVFRNNNIVLDWILTEAGACCMTPEGQFDSMGGWKQAYNNNWLAYKQHLQEFAGRLKTSPARVLGVNIFTTNALNDWSSFNIGAAEYAAW